MTSPVSLIVSAAAPVGNVRLTLTPELRKDVKSVLLAADLGFGKNRMGASILAQCVQSFGDTAPDVDCPETLAKFVRLIRKLTLAGCVLSYHDRSDGGFAATAAEMMFASHCGVTLNAEMLEIGRASCRERV